ncbi:polysaccharide lyase 6 family protein [Candidatus Laterigemmans baculatus]|nr:polysaccharide lyase 6 family protein [Candidatus Laterigemmans baculatus]
MLDSLWRYALGVFFLAWVLPAIPAQGEGIDSQAAAQAAISSAKPGDEIVLARGRYDQWKLTVDCAGTAEAPITIRSEVPGGVVLDGRSSFTITGAHVVVSGLIFDGADSPSARSLIVFDGAVGARLTESEFRGCRMTSGDAVVAVAGTSQDCRVDHCRFLGTRYRSIRIVVDSASLRTAPPLRTRIDHNEFRDVPRLGGNGAETIQIGSRAAPYCDLETFAVVEENLFVACNGEAEIISDKTSQNTFRKNLFLKCRGELVIRHGNRSAIIDNRFIDCSGGIRLSGGGHTVTGNTIVNSGGTGIQLLYGVEDSQHPAAYLPVSDCLIENNMIVNAREAGLMIGANRNQRWYSERWARKPYEASPRMAATIAPANNTIRDNTIIGHPDRLLVIDQAPENEIRNNHLSSVSSP